MSEHLTRGYSSLHFSELFTDSEVAALLGEDRTTLIEMCLSDITRFPDPRKHSGDPLKIACLVELGRGDLVAEDVLDRLWELASTDVAMKGGDGRAASAIGRVAVGTYDPAWVDRLFDLLRCANGEGRACALAYVAVLDSDDRSLPALIRAMADDGSFLVADREHLFGRIASSGLPVLTAIDALLAQDVLLRFINPLGVGRDPNPKIAGRQIASAALAKRGVLEDGYFKDPKDLRVVADALVDSLSAGSPYSAERATQLVYGQIKKGHIGVSEAVSAIVGCLAAGTIDRFGSQTGEAALLELREYWRPGDFDALVHSASPKQRRKAVDFLKRSRDPGVRAGLQVLAGDPEKRVASAAAKALAKS